MMTANPVANIVTCTAMTTSRHLLAQHCWEPKPVKLIVGGVNVKILNEDGEQRAFPTCYAVHETKNTASKDAGSKLGG